MDRPTRKALIKTYDEAYEATHTLYRLAGVLFNGEEDEHAKERFASLRGILAGLMRTMETREGELKIDEDIAMRNEGSRSE